MRKDICTPYGTLFTTAKIWKQPKRPSKDECGIFNIPTMQIRKRTLSILCKLEEKVTDYPLTAGVI